MNAMMTAEQRTSDDPANWSDERLVAEFKRAMSDRHANNP